MPDSTNILPDSRAKTIKGRVSVKGTSYVPIYCANCGADGGGVPEEHMTFAFYLCFAPGTPVRTREGWRPIENIAIGDEVLTHKGQWRQVKDVMRTPRGDRKVYRVRAVGDLDPVVVTEEHPFFVVKREQLAVSDSSPVRWNDYDGNQKQVLPQWLPVEDLSIGDYVSYVLDTDEIEHAELTAHTARILGYYAAEGHIQRCFYKPTTDRGRPTGADVAVRWTFNIKETDLVDDLRRSLIAAGYREPRVYTAPKQNAMYVVSHGRELADLCLRHVGRGSSAKTLSMDVLHAPTEWQRSFVGAYLNGDGSLDKKSGRIRFASTSKEMAQQLQLMILRQRIWCHMHAESRPNGLAYYGAIGKEDAGAFADVTKFDLVGARGQSSARCKIVEGILYRPVTDIDMLTSAPDEYFNLSVEGDESYVVGLTVVHNCNPCCEKWGPIAGTYVEPDAVFFEKVKQAQLEEHGHLLDGEELAKVLADPSSVLSKLVREAPKGK